MNYVRDYSAGWLFGFSHVCVSELMEILEKFDTNKAAVIDGLSGIFYKRRCKNTV